MFSGLRVFVPISAASLVAIACTSSASSQQANSNTACAVDASVVCLQGTGYSCGGSTPPNLANLECSEGVADSNGSFAFCCFALSSSSCTQDDSVPGCTGDSFGFSCNGADPPNSGSGDNGALICSEATADGSSLLYCCTTPAVIPCQPDASVTCAQGNGYSCGGDLTPDTSTEDCSDPTPNGALNDFCCITFQSTTCANDDSITGCAEGSYGFSCSGTETPDDADSSLTCSAGSQNGTATLYCCTL